MPLVCNACNAFRSSEDKAIGVILVVPADCAACGRPLSQKDVCKCDGSDMPIIKARIGPSRIDHKVWSWSPRRREEELRKCQVLCHDCHLRKTSASVEAPHGNGRYTSKKWRCRCDVCRAAHATINAQYR